MTPLLRNPPQVSIQLDGHPQAEHNCMGYVAKWREYFNSLDNGDIALLVVPAFEGDYMEMVNAKTRNMIRKADKLYYECSGFMYNNHLDEMIAVNRSVPERQGRPMSPAYHETLQPIGYGGVTCSHHEQVYVGVFNPHGTLVAYCWLAICNQVAIINRILGHHDYLKAGIMNLLIKELVEVCQRHRFIHYLNYTTMESATDGLKAFKKHVGFKPYNVKVVA